MHKMQKINFYLMLFIAGGVTYRQNDYVIISERFEFEPNTKYFGNLKYHNFKYNRTFAALNVSAYFKIDFKRELRAAVQGYKMASNEYRFFPIVFDAEPCQLIEHDTFGLQNLYTVKCGHPPRCPFVKGNYSLCKWQPDFTKFPPYIPEGSYRIDFNFSHFSTQIMYVQWYMTVKRDPLERTNLFS